MNATEQLPWQSIYDELGVKTPPLDDRPLGYFVAQHASERPDAVALQYHEQAISYADLNAQANRLANALLALGMNRDSVLGIHLPNMPQYVAALVACSRIGCAASGVSPLMTVSEIAHQVQDARISALLTFDTMMGGSLKNLEELPEALKHIVVVSTDERLTGAASENLSSADIAVHDYNSLVEGSSPDFVQQPVSGTDTMMVQYTGGTTGRPKGAELTVRNLMYNPLQHSAYAPWDTGSEVVATAFPFFHAAGLAFVIASLRFGARLFIIPDPRDVGYFCGLMKKYPPTRLAAVPSLYQMLLACPDFSEIDFRQLKVANSGAAPLAGQDRKNIEAIIGRNKVSDMFGMTETGPVHVCNPPGRANADSVGIPVPGTDTRIVDLETGTHEMPRGEAGEIITCGPQVMKGYLNLPEETANALRPWRGKTWMYTGDVGYMDEEGYIYLCDRAKDMLIVGGYKVFSVEVEDKLQALDSIACCAVIGTADEKRPGNDTVNLVVQLAAGHRARDEEEIRQEITVFCRQHMAPYKVPKVITFVDQIPLTGVGKVDKKRLRAAQLTAA